MQTSLLKRVWRIARWLAAGFVVLFLFRLTYGYLTPASVNASRYGNFFDGQTNLRKNYASEKEVAMMEKVVLPDNAAAANSQKYEKTAEVTSKTLGFDKDDKAIRAATNGFKGVIQYENAFGLKGSRELHLLIGIVPEAFDSFYTEIRKIGEIRSMSVVKEDKTNEYRQLNARKASLEKTLASLQELKSKGGEISDFVGLHDKILDIESQLQQLGVQLGNFNSENEFCTVKFSLYEGAPSKGISFMHRLKVALEWTLQYYLVFLCIVLVMSVTAFLLLLIADKLKIMQQINRDNP